MSRAEQTVVQQLGESRSSERALVETLHAHISLAPRGRHRRTLETNLRQSEDHVRRIDARLREMGYGRGLVTSGLGLFTGALERGVALGAAPLRIGTAPLRIVRGAREEQVLKQAPEDCARHAHAVASHAALADVARTLEDSKTAELARRLRGRQQKMLDRLLAEVPRLADAVVDAKVFDKPAYEASQRGAADSIRNAAHEARGKAKTADRKARRTGRRARKVPGVARGEGELKSALASATDLPIANYHALSATQIVERLPNLSQIDLARVDAYERRSENRATITARIAALRRQEPWPGYDGLSEQEVRSVLGEGDGSTAGRIVSYERAHKRRTGVLDAAEREPAHGSARSTDS